MIYTIVTLTVSTADTEHEIYMQRLAKGKSLLTIEDRADKICAKWWDNPDEFTPIITASLPREIPQEDYHLLAKYLDELN